MTDDKIIELINKLIERTESNIALWKESNRDNEFILKFKDGRITVDYWTDENSQYYYELVLYNKDGKDIDRIIENGSENSNILSLLEKLHKTVKRKVFKVEETIDGLLKELESGEKIGESDEDEVQF